MTLSGRLKARANEAVAWRVAQQVEPLKTTVDRLDAENRSHRERLAAIDHRLGVIDGRLDAVERESGWSANELARLNPQVASFETRLEQQARPEVLTGALEDLPEARSLVETIREEHARVRARLALVSAYEERLRRLEGRMLQQDRDTAAS